MSIDLRSDTVTRPSERMRRAMADAEVGDDVFREDPTAIRLEERAAELLGKEAALFVPSGTMGNQIALHLHGRPGCEVVCEAESHILLYELGAMAALSGLLPKPVAGEAGLLAPEDVEKAIAPEVVYRSRTALLSLENTHNMAGGTIYRRDRLASLLAVARRHELPVHLDGSRLFNAAVALDLPVAELAAGCDSVMIALSKGLGAPAGSLLAGSRPWIAEARRVRKMFGGAMRQVGVLAAPGLLALEEGPAALAADHRHARRLAEALAALPGWGIDLKRVETNIVIASPPGGDAYTFCRQASRAGVMAVPVSAEAVRFVTHRDVSSDDVDQAIQVIRTLRAC
ncbi:MAG: GntG family PLP-dependent aldolase [Acidobacteriota bacterium]